MPGQRTGIHKEVNAISNNQTLPQKAWSYNKPFIAWNHVHAMQNWTEVAVN